MKSTNSIMHKCTCDKVTRPELEKHMKVSFWIGFGCGILYGILLMLIGG